MTFRDQGTEDVFDGADTRGARKACPRELWPIARRKLDQLNRVIDLQELAVPLLTDPLNRLHRAYGMSCSCSSGKANTFLIDPDRILRHHIIHELTTWNMEALCGLLALGLPRGAQNDSGHSERSQECRR